MIKAVIFDFDGTLSIRQEGAYGIYEDYFRRYFSDMDEIGFEAVLQDMMLYECNGTISMKNRVANFRKKYGEYLPEGFEQEFLPYYYAHMHEYTVAREGIKEVLGQLKGKYRLGILSNGDSFSQHAKIRQIGVEEYFDAVIVSDDYGIDKPDQEIFAKMCELLDVKAEECVMIGDVFSSDILGAVRCGMTPIWIKTDNDRPVHFYQGYVIKRPEEIPGILEEIEKGETE